MPSARLTISLALLLLLAPACRRQVDASPLVASAYGYELHRSDLDGLVPAGLPADDSLAVISNYIDQWVRQTVILAKAEKNVKDDFDRELLEYKNNLLTYTYERQIVDQLLDTVVSSAQIEEYYAAHRSDFRLKSSIVKAVYVSLPTASPALRKLNNILSRSPFRESDIVEFEETASRAGLKGYYDADAWMPFYSLQTAVPITVYNENLFLRQNRTIAIRDDSLSYLVRILDYKVSDDEAPLELQRDNIRAIILNHRKIEIINNLHADLLKEAEDGGHVTRNF